MTQTQTYAQAAATPTALAILATQIATQTLTGTTVVKRALVTKTTRMTRRALITDATLQESTTAMPPNFCVCM